MHGGGQEAAGDEEVVGEVGQDIKQREIGGGALWNDKIEVREKLVTAEQESKADEDDAGKIKASGRSESTKTAEHEQVKRYIEVALNGCGHHDSGRFDGSIRHGRLYCWRNGRGREVSAVTRGKIRCDKPCKT